MENNKTVITCVNNGPARVEGNFTLIFPDGTQKEIEGRLSLCRCGISEKMPLCDGSHKNCTPRHDHKLNILP